jgi:hypothetical protein
LLTLVFILASIIGEFFLPHPVERSQIWSLRKVIWPSEKLLTRSGSAQALHTHL